MIISRNNIRVYVGAISACILSVLADSFLGKMDTVEVIRRVLLKYDKVTY